MLLGQLGSNRQYHILYYAVFGSCLYSNQTMKRAQNYSNCRVRTSEEDDKFTSRPTETRKAESREKSIPKFNRKTEMRPFTRKKSETNLAIEPICFISPKRNTQPLNSMFKSTRFEDIAHNFSTSIFETPTERSTDLSLTSRFNQSTAQSRVTTVRSRQSDDEAESYKLELDSLKLEIERVLKENTALKSKVEDFNGLQSFLVERETYIFQLTGSNAKINQELIAVNTHKLQLNEEVQSLKVQLVESSAVFGGKYAELMTQFQTQKNEITAILKANSKLQEELKVARQSSSAEKKKTVSKRYKENNEQVNRSKHRGFAKSKSMLISLPVPIVEEEKSVSELGDADINCLASASASDFSSSLKEIMEEQSSTASSSFFHEPSEDQLHAERLTFQGLRQKLRYSQIEIDILKKMKLDATSIQDENAKLKCKNRKLLHRVDYFASRSSRKRSNSNSSLELSLSPKKY